MSIRKIKYKGKVQTIKQWSIELGIPTKTIYQRLNNSWPPELALSSKYFHFCDDLKAASRVEQRDGYPIKFHLSVNKDKLCCNSESICVNAITITPWNEISNDPSEANYYCNLYNQFVWGEDPVC
jgi:hypothetical protein